MNQDYVYFLLIDSASPLQPCLWAGQSNIEVQRHGAMPFANRGWTWSML